MHLISSLQLLVLTTIIIMAHVTQIWRKHCNQEVTAFDIHLQSLGHELRLQWKENSGYSLEFSRPLSL